MIARHGSAGTPAHTNASPEGTAPMAHKFPNILIHLVFSTKNRRDLIPDELRTLLWKYLAGIGRNHKIPVLAVGGTANHVHVLITLPTDTTVAKAVQVLKANSSRWVGEHGIDFAWQEGYGAFSVSASHLPVVRDYIGHQQRHHAKRSYEDEFIMLLQEDRRGIRHPNRCSARVPSLAGLASSALMFPALPCRAILFRRFAAGVGLKIPTPAPPSSASD